MSNHSIWPIDKTLSGATTTSQSGPESDGNEEILRIPQSSSITGISPSDYLVSYPGHSLGESYPPAEMQSVYSTTPINWANQMKMIKTKKIINVQEKNITVAIYFFFIF